MNGSKLDTRINGRYYVLSEASQQNITVVKLEGCIIEVRNNYLRKKNTEGDFDAAVGNSRNDLVSYAVHMKSGVLFNHLRLFLAYS